MEPKHKGLKQACRKNQYKLRLTFMEGDCDGYAYGEVYSPSFDGEIAALYNLYSGLLREYKKGPWHKPETDHDIAVKAVMETPALRSVAVENEKYAEDHVNEYLHDLGHGCYGPSYDFPRRIYGVELTHFDDVGDEYFVQTEGEQGEL